MEHIKDKPQNKIYVIYYEGRQITDYDFKTKRYLSRPIKPRYGNALNRAKEIPLYLKMVYRVPKNRIVLVNGGYKEEFIMEFWSVPNGAEPPKPTPTLERKDIKFGKGKPRPPVNKDCCYGKC